MKLDTCHFGDVRAVLRDMISAGVQVNTIVTSPPYWGLRSYLPAEHPDKAFEIGSEPTIGEFITGMVEVFDLCRQVLRDDGTMWVNMGDSYANDGKWGGSTGGKHVTELHGDTGVGRAKVVTGLRPKNLVGQPWRLAFALQDAGWNLRQDIIWHKPNPMPESIRDRCTKAHEYIFLLSKSERYHYDFEAMQEPVEGTAHARRATVKMPDGWATHEGGHGSFHRDGREKGKSNGVGWGYADGPEAKPRTTRAAEDAQPGTGRRPAHDFTETGRRGRKLAPAGSGTKLNESYDAAIGSGELTTTRNRRSVWTVPSEPYSGAHFATFPRKLIEPCILAGCPVGGIVLDPFFGSGTTGQVAQQLGRRFLGIDINRANEPLQVERLRQPSLQLEVA